MTSIDVSLCLLHNISPRLLTLFVVREVYYTSVLDVEVNPEMPRKQGKAVPKAMAVFSITMNLGLANPR